MRSNASRRRKTLVRPSCRPATAQRVPKSRDSNSSTVSGISMLDWALIRFFFFIGAWAFSFLTE